MANRKSFKRAIVLASLAAIGCNKSASAQAAPTIEIVSPRANDVISDYPIFIEVKVNNCTLEPPVQYWSAVPRTDATIGHIHYTLDNTPIFATKSTHVVMMKPAGNALPVGKHILKAEIVTINHEPRNPPVFAEIPIVCQRAQQKEAGNAAVVMDARTRDELQKLEKQLVEVQEQLKEVKAQAKEVPNP